MVTTVIRRYEPQLEEKGGMSEGVISQWIALVSHVNVEVRSRRCVADITVAVE